MKRQNFVVGIYDKKFSSQFLMNNKNENMNFLKESEKKR